MDVIRFQDPVFCVVLLRYKLLFSYCCLLFKFSFHSMSSLNLFSYATEEDSIPSQKEQSIQEETKSVVPSSNNQTPSNDQNPVGISSVKRDQSNLEQTVESKQVKQTPSVPISSNVYKVPEAIWKAVLDKKTNRYYYWNKASVSCVNYSVENK